MVATPANLPVESERGAERLDDALAVPGATVAVVANPFFGTETLLDRAAAAVDGATRVAFGPGSTTLPEFDRPLVLDDCHHLYARHIGGFDSLDRFLDRLAASSSRVVTSWNRHSWNYLDAVRDVGDAFQHVLSVPPLSADRIAETIRSERDALPTFESPSGRRDSPITTATYRLPLPRREPVPVRVPAIDADYVAAWLSDRDSPTPAELVFQRLTRLAGGNPGVASAVWDACVDGASVTPADLALPVDATDLRDGAARVLGVLVAKGAVTRDELLAVVPDLALDRTLRTLVEEGFVTTGDAVRLRPAGLPSAVEALDRRRWLW